MTPFWDTGQRFSLMTFTSADRASNTPSRQNGDWMRRGASQISSRKLQAGDIEFTCWQYLRQTRRPFRFLIAPLYANGPFWEVDCETPADVDNEYLSASFFGREEDTPPFTR